MVGADEAQDDDERSLVGVRLAVEGAGAAAAITASWKLRGAAVGAAWVRPLPALMVWRMRRQSLPR